MPAMNTWTQKLKILFVTVPRKIKYFKKIKYLIYRPLYRPYRTTTKNADKRNQRRVKQRDTPCS